MSSTCPHCGCSDIEIEPARGDAICTSCGVVLSEHNIVSEVQFLENSKGGSTAVGQFISSEAVSSRTNFLRSFQGAYSRKSKEITLSNAHKRIKALAQQLRLNNHCIETAFNFFKLGLSKGLTKGRKNTSIIGACVYITCRTESTAHMLIDVSDALQIDVYELGRTYLRLSTALCITIPAMDPCLYILRFAHKLSFGNSTHEVSETALKLVKRMKRDWIHTGRRPSGLCGAALVLAARLHNFNRTIPDVIKVVKVHESTLRKRLTEFGETPSSALTPQEFMTTDLDEEQDPPAFKAARKKEQERVQMLIDKNKNLDNELSEIQQEIEKHLEERRKKLRGIWAKYSCEGKKKPISNGKNLKENPQTVGTGDAIVNSFNQSNSNDKEANDAEKFITESTLNSINECLGNTKDELADISKSYIGIGPSAASLGLKDSIEDCMKVHPSNPEPEDSGILDLTGIDDDEINSYIMSEREIKLKTDLWMEVNKEYLEEMRLKEEREKKEAEEREKEGKPAKKRKTYNKKPKNNTPANTAGEAIEKMLQEKRISNKINYDVLRNLNGEEEEINMKYEEPIITTPQKAPVETPEGIQSILHSLTGKRLPDSELRPEEKHIKPDMKEHEKEEEEEEEDEEEEDREEEEEDTLELLRKRRGETEYDIEYYDDYE